MFVDLTCDTQILFHATTDDDKIYNTLHEPIITDVSKAKVTQFLQNT